MAQASERKAKRPTVLSVLETLGYRFGLDYDNELEIREPEELNETALRALLRDAGDFLAFDVRHRASRERRVCIGGPLDGRSHLWPHCSPLMAPGYGPNDLETPGAVMSYGRAASRIRRGKWAAYAIASDGRAFYAGEATNKVEARKLAARFHVPG